jgi:DNA-directed RNA polymerase subunit RPC12/RpoP
MSEQFTQPSTPHLLQQCPKCSGPLDPHWDFCPHCAAPNAGAFHVAPAPRKHQRYPLRHAFGGLYFGLVIAPACLILGGMLCCTILGAFAGIPLIILGILSPLLGTILGLNELNGKCPWCGTRIVSVFNHTHDFACPACSHMIAVHNHELQKAA